METLKSLADQLKLNQSILRLFEILVYAFMESSTSNQSLHQAFRVHVKKRFFIQCLKIFSEFKTSTQMFKSAAVPTETYIWNSSIEGDEMCIESLKELKQQ